MNTNSPETIRQIQQYKMLLRNLRKQQEDIANETISDEKTDCNQSK